MSDDIQVVTSNTSATYAETKEVVSGVHRSVMTGGLAHGIDDAMVHTPVIQLLDTIGDGSGVTEHAADYSGALDEIMLVPSGSNNVFVKRLVIAIADGVPSGGGFAGLGSSLINGIEIQKRDGSGLVAGYDITGGDAIVDTEHLLRICTSVSTGQFGTGVWYFHGVIDFEQLMGHLLKIDGGANEFLTVRLNDDFSDLDSMKFQAYGLQE